MEIALTECSEHYAKRSENRDCPNPAERALRLRETGFLESDRRVSESFRSLRAAMGTRGSTAGAATRSQKTVERLRVWRRARCLDRTPLAKNDYAKTQWLRASDRGFCF